MNFGKAAIFGVVLFCLLWTEGAQAGLTFLSPADMQKIAERQSQNKLRHGNMNRRGVEDDLAGEEIGVTFPLDMKMTQEQFQKQRAAVQDFLYSSLLSLGSVQDTEDKNENPQSQ
ncbi:ghrelin isoform X2 [Aquarana catesbeiana]|uniref:Ghrelin n=2 Tax=Aquarana catesbeiana TaxID=8400 RepID=GHRL_AQUCT|nr:RecName: Full=Ghrelin; Contains: RecName: Full=Ghrelin-27; Contains: RecName: Full=Ghrelin-28; Flags: Precursor [Aquarana catesbeiana]BAB71718.1 preproghrelin [Aquarana catesbeiana]